MQTAVRRTLLPFLAICITACAGAPHRQINPAPALNSTAPSRAAAPEGSDASEPAAPPAAPVVVDRTAVVVGQATDAYLLGEESYRAGDMDTARSHFDDAVLILLRSGLDPQVQPRLRGAFDRITGDIQSLEAESLQASDDDSTGSEQAPFEELKSITDFLSPEELKKEMAKVEPPARDDQFSIPVVLNERVLTLMDAFENKWSDAFTGGYRRMGRYEGMIRRILRDEGLPEDLVYLAFVESTFKPNAYSRARAKGIWQFMSSTGARYGLVRNAYVDERSDPEKATRAAALYLKDLYSMFGDWYLALAAYNAGEGKIVRAMERTGEHDFWALARTRYLRTETKNFVPSILAVSIISRDPARHGFPDLTKDPPLEYDKVYLDGPAELSLVAKLAGTSVEEIRKLNPNLRRAVTPPGYRRFEVNVPVGAGDTFTSAYAELPASEKIARTQIVYRVRRGDTLSRIASRYGTTSSSLARNNGISTRTILSIGMKLLVPNGGVVRRASSYYGSDHHAGPDGRYIVARGDTLWSIAMRHGTSADRLAEINRLSKSSILRPGQILLVDASSKWSGDADEDGPEEIGTYRVRRGDTLSSIARRHGIGLGELLSINGLSRHSTIYPGQRLKVRTASRQASRSGSFSGASSQGPIHYVVKRGDSLYEIAQRHNTSVARLRSWNDLGRGTLIHPGDVLTIRSR